MKILLTCFALFSLGACSGVLIMCMFFVASAADRIETPELEPDSQPQTKEF
jgi:hypothetical protein